MSVIKDDDDYGSARKRQREILYTSRQDKACEVVGETLAVTETANYFNMSELKPLGHCG